MTCALCVTEGKMVIFNKWGWNSHFILKPQNPNPTLLFLSFIFQKPHFLGNQTSLTKILSQKTFHNLELGPLTKKKKKKLKKKKNPWNVCPKTFSIKTSINPNETERYQNCNRLWRCNEWKTKMSNINKGEKNAITNCKEVSPKFPELFWNIKMKPYSKTTNWSIISKFSSIFFIDLKKTISPIFLQIFWNIKMKP